MGAISELATMEGKALSEEPIDPLIELPIEERQKKQLLELLTIKNGFYALYGALHVFPIGKHPEHMDLVSWNAPDLWKDRYKFVKDSFLCFAENILGEQYCIYGNGVGRFNPETGRVKHLAEDVEGWARLVVDDNREVGYSWARDWQREHFVLPIGCRLALNQPAVTGGDFDIRNMLYVNAIEGMRFWGDFATLIHDLPNGAEIELNLVRVLPDGTKVKVGAVPQK